MIRFLFLLFISVGCVPRSPAATQPDIVRRAQVMAQSDRMASIRLLEDELQSGRRDPSVEPWAMLWAGEQRRLARNPAEARRWFEQLAARYPSHQLKDPAILGMAMVDAEKTLSGNTLATMQLMDEQNVPDTMNADRYATLALVGADEGTPAPKVRALARKAIDYASSDADVLARIKVSLQAILQESKGPAESEPVTSVPTGTPEEIALKRARAALVSGDMASATEQANGAVETWPASIHRLEFEYIARRAAKGNPTLAGKVGVLLPASGDYAPAAAQLREVIELANAEAGNPISFVFGDTQGTPEGTVTEIERLVIEEGCVAILGPLLKNNGDEAAKRAVALRTPLVTLTQGGDPAGAGEFAFRGFMTLQHQVEALLHHAFQLEGHRRFAVLHPENGYGTSARDLFTAGVASRGGEVTVIQSYAEDATDFLVTAQEMTGKDKEARSDELYALRKAAERRDEDPDDVMLPPIINFDAIFIPDNHRRLVLVTSALAYEEVPVGSFRKHVDEEPVQLLGLNAWNTPQLVANGGRYVQNSAFVDAFWSEDEDEAVQQFITTFQSTVERAPRVIDALTWDATRLLTAAVLEGGDSREAIQEAMSKIEIDDPVAGGQSFNEDREVARAFHVLTIKRSGIEAWTPPPPSEESPAPAVP